MTKPTTRSPRSTPRTVTPELVRDALASIPPDVDRDTWARLAMAIKSELAATVGFDLWAEWSARGATYNERNARDTWRSIKAGGATTIATLFGIAKDHGFKMPKADAGTAVQTPAQAAAAQAEAERLAGERRRKQDADSAEYRRRAELAAGDARALWDEASPTPPAGLETYPDRKGVKSYGVRYLADGTTFVPLCNEAGELQNLQRIAPQKPTDGAPEKRFLPAGRKSGLWHLIGTIEGAPVLLLAEGYATAASIHEATGLPVTVAFDAGNLVHVAKALRALHPTVPMLVCGDDDCETEARTGKNPGRAAAAVAARAAHTDAAPAGVVFPEGLPDGGTDFNDLAAHAGLDAVRALIAPAAASPSIPKPRRAAAQPVGEANAIVEVSVPAAASATPPKGRQRGRRVAETAAGGDDDARDGDDPQQPEPERRGRDPFYVDESGLWFVARDTNGDDKPAMWLCDPVYVTAITRDETDNGYGYLVEFINRDGHPRTWAAPSALFGGDSSDWAARLRDMGLRMATGAKARNLVGQYIDSRNPVERVTCTDRVGWHGGGVYVLPSRCIGPTNGKRFVFQSDSGMEDTFRRRGELPAWQANVAAPCAGNTRLVFALCCAFGGPLMGLLGVPTGIFHLEGNSSLGKTTALLVAASVWGSPKFKQQWRTTDNGLEGVAVQHSDCLLILDEIGQMDGRVVGDCAYMIANEAEKIRGSRGVLARKRRTWRLLGLSSGEKGLAAHMMEAGKKPNEGQMVRMPSIPADAGAGLGMFERLAGVPAGDNAGKLFAELITAASASHFGSAGLAWLQWLSDNMAVVAEQGAALMRRMENEWVPERAHPQVWRVATRFALVGAAGEMATAAGVTGWQEGEAERAAQVCFDAWLKTRGHAGNGEEAAMVRHVAAFLEKNGDALFTWTHRAMDDHKASTPLRAGFKRMLDDAGNPLKIDAASDYVERRGTVESNEQRHAQVEYLVLSEAFRRDVCKGFDPAAVAEVLRKRGHLVHQKDRLTSKQRLPGMGKDPVPCYHVKPSIFADEI